MKVRSTWPRDVRPSQDAPVQPIAPRGDAPPPRVFRVGAHAPYAIRWFGSSALIGHLRHFVAAAIASESIDSRDWMRPQTAGKLLRTTSRALGASEEAPTLVEALGRPLWIDFVADTGDDRDISAAVARMIAGTYSADGEPLPRGDILLFGGDTAYPVATADEIFRRLTQPWNEVLREVGVDRRRVLLGIPGNHDWYDGLDGFARLFRRNLLPGAHVETGGPSRRGERAHRLRRGAGLVAKGLHLDEALESLGLVASAARGVRAFFRGDLINRRKRLALVGYEAVQECSYWSLPLAPGLDAWGADRQLRRVDFRQRFHFLRRREQVPRARILLCTADPALAFGERNPKGQNVLVGCGLRLDRDQVFYLCGDVHHYERRTVAESVHVIAGGGGAFLHGTRINPLRAGVHAGALGCAYPDARTSRTLVLAAPLKMMLGQAGFLPHIAFALVAIFEEGMAFRSSAAQLAITALITGIMAVTFYMNAGHHRPHPRLVLTVAVPFALVLGMGPTLLGFALPRVVPQMAGATAVVLVYSFLGAFGFGLFLATCAVLGIEHEQAFAALGHPGFKHFVRLRIGLDGSIRAWAIGKDDPLDPGAPVIIDRFEW